MSGFTNGWGSLFGNSGLNTAGMDATEAAIRRAQSGKGASASDRKLRAALNSSRLGSSVNGSGIGERFAGSRVGSYQLPAKLQSVAGNKWAQRAGKWGGVAGVGMMGVSDVGTLTNGGITNGWGSGADADPNKWLAAGNGVAMAAGGFFGGAAGAAAAGAGWNMLANENNFRAINSTIGDGSMQAAADAEARAEAGLTADYTNFTPRTDASGNKIAFTADKATTDGSGVVFRFQFDADGNVQSRSKVAAPQTPKTPSMADLMQQYAQFAPQATSMPDDVVASLTTSARQRADAVAALEGRYNTQVSDLKKNYQLSETAEEKATLAKLLAGYEKTYKRSKAEVNTTYDDLVADAVATTEQTRSDRDANTQAVKDIWADASNNAAAAQAYARGEGDNLAGGGIGVNTAAATDANAQAAIANVAAQAAEAATATNSLGNDAVNQANSYRSDVSAARGDQLYWLGNEYDSRVDGATAGHAQEVAQRITAERQAYANLVSQLSAQRLQAVEGLQNQYHSDDTQIAGLRAQWAQNEAGKLNSFYQNLFNSGMSYDLERQQAAYAAQAAAAENSQYAAAAARGDWYGALNPESRQKVSQAKYAQANGLG